MEFARQLQATVDPAIKDRDQRMYEAKEKALADGVVSRNAWEKAPLTASSDSGDVSQMMPMNLFTAVCWPVGVAPHTWQSCASAGSTMSLMHLSVCVSYIGIRHDCGYLCRYILNALHHIEHIIHLTAS